MRRRDIRAARRASPKRHTLAEYAPLPAANDDDPQGDEAWRDAIAGSHDNDTGIVGPSGKYIDERNA